MLLRNLHLIRIINLKKFSSVFSACLMSEIRNNVHFVWMNPSNRPSMRYQSSAPLIYPEYAFTYLDLPDDPAIDLYVMGTLTGEKVNTSWLLFFKTSYDFPIDGFGASVDLQSRIAWSGIGRTLPFRGFIVTSSCFDISRGIAPDWYPPKDADDFSWQTSRLLGYNYVTIFSRFNWRVEIDI